MFRDFIQLAAQILNRNGAESCQVTIVQMEKFGICMRICSLEMDQGT